MEAKGDVEVKERIEAAYDKEFDEILERLGLKDDLMAGRTKCGFCDQQLDMTKIIGVYSDQGRILLCCDRQECAARLAEKTVAE